MQWVIFDLEANYRFPNSQQTNYHFPVSVKSILHKFTCANLTPKLSAGTGNQLNAKQEAKLQTPTPKSSIEKVAIQTEIRWFSPEGLRTFGLECGKHIPGSRHRSPIAWFFFHCSFPIGPRPSGIITT